MVTFTINIPPIGHVVSKSGSLASQDSRSSWSEYLLSAAANGAQRCPMVLNIPRRFLFSTRHSNWTDRFEQDFVTSGFNMF